MLTLFHSPRSRSTRVIALLQALGVMDQVDIRLVTILRQDGSGMRDPANPHPDGKVPLLVHDGVEVWESAAIMTYLCDLFPEAGLGVPHGHPDRGRFLSWMVWYGSVVEPALILDEAGISHPSMTAAIRGRAQVLARLTDALSTAPWLMGDRFTVADLLMASGFMFYKDPLPDHAAVRDWVARVGAKGLLAAVMPFEADAVARLAAQAAAA
jgi:glutathione S-transferase